MLRKPLYVLAASAAATAGAILLAIKLAVGPEEGPKSYPTDDLPAEPEKEHARSSAPEEPATADESIVCGSMRLVKAPFAGEISAPEEVSFAVSTMTPTCICYSICNSGSPLFYDPHIFPTAQYELNGEWHDLVLNEFPITRDLAAEELPSMPTGMLMDTALYYTALNEPGNYRLIAEVYTSLEGFMKADPAEKLYLAADFTV